LIDTHRTYRTKDGKRVRALRIAQIDQQVIVRGEPRLTGRKERVIVGEIHMKSLNEWTANIWKEQGEDYSGDQDLSLVEEKIEVRPQPTLF
jgi:hypothetical protein